MMMIIISLPPTSNPLFFLVFVDFMLVSCKISRSFSSSCWILDSRESWFGDDPHQVFLVSVSWHGDEVVFLPKWDLPLMKSGISENLHLFESSSSLMILSLTLLLFSRSVSHRVSCCDSYCVFYTFLQ
jgi:hypothetical protein